MNTDLFPTRFINPPSEEQKCNVMKSKCGRNDEIEMLSNKNRGLILIDFEPVMLLFFTQLSWNENWAFVKPSFHETKTEYVRLVGLRETQLSCYEN